MSIDHGKKYKKNIESMTNRSVGEIDTEISRLDSSTNDIINDLKIMIDPFILKMNSFNDRKNLMLDTTNIYSNNVFKDVCNNYFRVNEKGVIKQFTFPNEDVITSYNNNIDNKDIFKDNNINLTDLNPYQEIKVGVKNISDQSYNLIKGTNIAEVENDIHLHNNEGKLIFSNTIVDSNYELNSVNTGNCYTLKQGREFLADTTFSNISNPLECKQLAIDNYYQHYIVREESDGSLNCHLFNNNNLLDNYDVSENACTMNNNFEVGLSLQNSYAIYDNIQVGSANNFRQGGYIDFDTNFVRQTENNADIFKNDNENYVKFENRSFNSLGSEISCNLLEADDTIIGYVQNASNLDKCYEINNEILIDPKQRIFDPGYNIIMKNKKYIEGFETALVSSHLLSKYNEVSIPTFTIKDILNNELTQFPDKMASIQSKKEIITSNQLKIFQELEKYNNILREANLKLSNNINNNSNYVTNIESKLNNNLTNNYDELKRKLNDQKLVLDYNHNKYILWTLLGVASVIVLLKVSKINNNPST